MNWLRAGLGAGAAVAALVTGSAMASASPDEGADHSGVTARQGRDPAARAHPRGSDLRPSRSPAATAARPAGSRALQAFADDVVPEPIAAPTALASAPADPGPTASATAPADPGPIQSAILASQAYIYGYPLMEYQRVRQTVGTVNTLYSLTSFANPDSDPIWQSIGGGKRPNVDTFYSLAELDLSQGPVLLSIPDMGNRYFSFQLTDPYTNASAYIGSRTTGYGPGTYAITWQDGPKAGPEAEIPGATTILVPYSSMLALGRTLAGDAADQKQAIALMQQYTLTPVGGTVSPVVPIPKPGIGYLDAISATMELNPAPAIDAPALASFAHIGVGPGLRVADAHLGVLSTIAADLAVRATAALLPLLATLNQYAAAVQNRGWATPDPAIGNYGTDYLLRAGVAELGLLANIPDEAVYSAGLLSGNLLPLYGCGVAPYVLHFAPGQEPPASAFWSVTVYDGNGNLVPNSQHRYSVSSSRPDELVRRPDGSIDIVFSPTDPGDPGANWLKVPYGGAFNAYLRMYAPDQQVLDGTWTAPPIEHRWLA